MLNYYNVNFLTINSEHVMQPEVCVYRYRIKEVALKM